MKAGSDKCILVINGGSSTLKFSLYHTHSSKIEFSGEVNHIGSKQGSMEINSHDKIIFKNSASYENLVEGANALIGWLKDNLHDFSIAGIGHRLVQGGPEHRKPELITDDVLHALQEFVYLAPNHLPNEIQTIKTFKSAFPDIPQVACFDTYFHRDLPSFTKYYPLPEEYKNKGLMRYGFHGLSYEYILQKLTEETSSVSGKKIIIAHLGNGASMAAVSNGISVDTTMGLSPAGGLVMGTRSGDLDPGVILFLLKQEKLSTGRLDELLNKQSGLKAIAGISDVQELLKAEEAQDIKAKEALTIFCYAAKKSIGALAAAMGGLDLLVFTGGIGEHSFVIRERICSDLSFMGIRINKVANREMQEIISSKISRVTVKMMKTDEEQLIYKHTLNIINS